MIGLLGCQESARDDSYTSKSSELLGNPLTKSAALLEKELKEQGVSGVPVYLPSRLPAGFSMLEPGSEILGPYGPYGPVKKNPWAWSSADPAPRSGGYSVVFTDGVSCIRLDVNPAADLRDVQWEELAERRGGRALKLAKAQNWVWVSTPNEDGVRILVDGPDLLREQVIELATSLQRWPDPGT